MPSFVSKVQSSPAGVVEGSILKEGYLDKRSTGRLGKRWQRRYFTVREQSLA
jgi:hypothetical protein